MSIDWKQVLTVVIAALLSAGGTVGAQTLIGPSTPTQMQALHLVKGMTGLCIRVEDTAPAAKLTTSSTTKDLK